MKSINKQYQDIIKKCKFISRPDEWFVEGTEAELQGDSFDEYKESDHFDDGSGLFHGLTNETFEGYTGELPRDDGEICPYDEFLIYDEFGNEISRLTLKEYKVVLRKMKLDNINESR